MTPKEKALELIEKYNLIVLDTALGGSNKRVKQCALIAVNEIISLRKGYFDCTNRMNDESYWQEVKAEIENN